MYGLPKSTEVSKQLPKKAIYEKFNMNTAQREKFDKDISRIVITNEVSPGTVSVAAGSQVSSFFVLEVFLKSKSYSDSTIIQLTKLIPQNVLFLLTCGDESRLAVFRVKLLTTPWVRKEEIGVTLNGLNLDAVWENIVASIGGVTVSAESTLDEQIANEIQREKLKKEIARLEKLARAEKQPKKKFELVQKINDYKSQLE